MAEKIFWKITIFCLSFSNSQDFLQYCIWLPMTLEVIECPKKLFKIMTFEIQFYISSHSILNCNFEGFKHYMYFTRFSTTLWKWPMTSEVINWKWMQKKDLFSDMFHLRSNWNRHTLWPLTSEVIECTKMIIKCSTFESLVFHFVRI